MPFQVCALVWIISNRHSRPEAGLFNHSAPRSGVLFRFFANLRPDGRDISIYPFSSPLI